MKFSESLKKNADFKKIYQQGNSKANKNFVMYVANNGSDINHLGISVSKKVGNSVVRHHITRLIREAYRLHEEEFKRGIDLIVVVRPNARDISFYDTERCMMHLANIFGILI